MFVIRILSILADALRFFPPSVNLFDNAAHCGVVAWFCPLARFPAFRQRHIKVTVDSEDNNQGGAVDEINGDDVGGRAC